MRSQRGKTEKTRRSLYSSKADIVAKEKGRMGGCFMRRRYVVDILLLSSPLLTLHSHGQPNRYAAVVKRTRPLAHHISSDTHNDSSYLHVVMSQAKLRF